MFLALVGPLLVLADPAKGSRSTTPGLTPDQTKPVDGKPGDKLDDRGNKRPQSPNKPEDKKPEDHDDKRPKPDDKGKQPQQKSDKNPSDENKHPNKPKDGNEVEYDCNGTPNACKNMCWGHFCRQGRIGSAEELQIKIGTDASKEHRGPTKSGHQTPGNDNVCTRSKKDGGWSEDPEHMKSMDEWPMASFEYDLNNKDVKHSVGFRCMEQKENNKAGSRLGNNMKRNQPYKIKFKNAGKDKLGVDWCEANRKCQNDGYQFSYIDGKYVEDPSGNKVSRDFIEPDLSSSADLESDVPEPVHPRDFLAEALEALKDL
ncbi:MAG: hypothetical protein M1835_003456 [Candelina submexicana]|nr:MAG: hypothetical protein M1835_003456 [Candelina submexicana]